MSTMLLWVGRRSNIVTLDEVFTKIPTLTTRRLTLRPMERSDAEAIFEIKGDPQVTERYGAENYTTIDQARKWVADRLAGYHKRESVFWMFTLKGESEAIGMCCYWHIDEQSRCAEIGYELNRAYWNKGITSEALVPIVKYGFDRMGLHRVEACPFSENAPSNKLLQSLGFKLEGTLRHRVQFRGRFIDQHYYSLLDGEFKPPPTVSP